MARDLEDDVLIHSIAESIDRMSRRSATPSAFATYTNGDRREEDKELNRHLQASTAASVRRALEQD